MPSRPSVPSVDSLRPKGSPLPEFLSPSEEPTTGPSPSDLPTIDATTEGWSSPQLPDDVLDEAPAPAGPTSSPASSGSELLADLPLQELAHAAVLGVSEMAHEELARDEASQVVGLWLADEDDAAAIGDPLASMMGRHVPKDVLGNNDAGDVIAAMVGVVVYGMKQFGRWRQARRLRAATRLAAAQAEAAAQPADAASGPYATA